MAAAAAAALGSLPAHLAPIAAATGASTASESWDQLEPSRWILIVVCVIGVLLAYATDEGYSLIVGSGEDESSPRSVGGSATPTKLGVDPATSFYRPGTVSYWCYQLALSGIQAVRQSYVYRFLIYVISLMIRIISLARPYLPRAVDARISQAGRTAGVWAAKLRLYRRSRQLKKVARTRRHYFYLLEKEILGLPVKSGETEVDSYLDCKNHLGSKWPFMWQVSDVRNSKIQCAGRPCVPMSSYSYLDLLRDSRVQRAAIAAAEAWSSGNHGPRMLGGNTTILCELEAKIAEYLGREATLLCATGYLACMSACAAICAENAVVFGDSRLHASLRAGLKIGEGKTVLFRHNDFADAEAQIKRRRSKFADAWMVIESVYSMDGDLGDLPAAVALCRKYDIKLVIDEAHGLGIVGATGRGLEEHYNLRGAASLIIGTFSKSFASIGGYICGSARYISYLDFHAAGNVFSAPLPAYCAGAVLEAFRIIMAEPQLVADTQRKSREFRELLRTGGGFWPADFPEKDRYELEGDPATTVLPVIFRDDIDRVIRIAVRLKNEGFMVSAVAFPACPLRTPRFRITCTAAYDDKLMRDFVKALVDATVAEPPSNFRQIVK